MTDAEEDALIPLPPPQPDIWARMRDAAKFYAGRMCGPLAKGY